MSANMTCPYCRREFDADQARDACKGCRSGGGCRNVKCPYCGYETPREPRWIGWLRRRLGK